MHKIIQREDEHMTDVSGFGQVLPVSQHRVLIDPLK